jgi:hypothetical protein
MLEGEAMIAHHSAHEDFVFRRHVNFGFKRSQII